jgi:hypothetical protein
LSHAINSRTVSCISSSISKSWYTLCRRVVISPSKCNRNLLDFRQKREIVDYFTNHPKCTQQQIADYFTTLWDVPVKHRTVMR